MISSGVTTEWKTFRHFMAIQPTENMQLLLKELVTNDTLVTMFPNLHTLANYQSVHSCFNCFSGEKFFVDGTIENGCKTA